MAKKKAKKAVKKVAKKKTGLKRTKPDNPVKSGLKATTKPVVVPEQVVDEPKAEEKVFCKCCRARIAVSEGFVCPYCSFQGCNRCVKNICPTCSRKIGG